MSEASAPRTVVFDLGGVLIDWIPGHLCRQMFDDEAEMERFLREICSNAWNLQMDRGMPFEEGVATLSQKHPDMTPYIEAFWIRWEEMIEGPINGNVETLRRLQASGVPLYALSNWSAQTWPFVRDRFTFLELFKGLLISGFEGTMKHLPHSSGTPRHRPGGRRFRRRSGRERCGRGTAWNSRRSFYRPGRTFCQPVAYGPALNRRVNRG